MSKPKKEIENDASEVTESKEQKFRRVANMRAKRAIYEINRLANMPSQPTYDILDVDAQKVLDKVTLAYQTFADLYTKIANGQTVRVSRKEQEDIF